MTQKSCCRRLMLWLNELAFLRELAVNFSLTLLLVTSCAADIAAPDKPVVPFIQDQQIIPSSQPEEIIFMQEGIASWYGEEFHGRATSAGEVFDMHDKTCAHKTLPLNTYVRITNLQNGSRTLARVNDRGPFVKDRIVDISYATAQALGLVQAGTGRVRLEALGVPDSDGWNNDSLAEALAKGNFTVQLGSFKDKDNAQRLAHKLASEYGDTRITTADTNQGRFYRVRVGRYKSLEQAEEVCKTLGGRGYAEAFALAE